MQRVAPAGFRVSLFAKSPQLPGGLLASATHRGRTTRSLLGSLLLYLNGRDGIEEHHRDEFCRNHGKLLIHKTEI